MMIIAVLFMAAMLFIYPENCLRSAKNGLDIWFSVVVPSLLPFMTASFILLKTGAVRLIAHMLSPVTRFLFAAPGESAYVFLAAALSGYPVGAKLTGELYAAQQISEREAQHIVRFTSVSGPVFLTGAVASGMLGLPEAGIYLVASHYLSAVLVGIISGLFERKHMPPSKTTLRGAVRIFQRDIASSEPIGALLSDSVYNAVTTLLKIGGFIIFFFVVIEALSVSGVIDLIARVYTPIAALAGMSTADSRALLVGGIEMTAGCNDAAQLGTTMTQKLALISSIITFGGLSIHIQTRAVCADAHLHTKRFMLAKTLQAFFAYGLCALMLTALPLSLPTSSFAAPSKTAACTGVVFATAVLIFLIVIRRVHYARNKHPANAP